MRKKLNLAIVGLGNCASSLIQGIAYYGDIRDRDEKIIGLINNYIGGYTIGDIDVVVGIDVNINKIGIPIADAIFQSPNCTIIFSKEKIFMNNVIPGPILDGISSRMEKKIELHNIEKNINLRKKDIVKELVDKEVDVLVSYLPVGSKEAAIFYAECALEAKVAYANAMPEFIVSTQGRSKKFEDAGVPCAGDDIKSQVGATIVHRNLVDLINKRGEIIDGTYQLNIGGNMDFENMLDESRLISKIISKTEAVTSLITEYELQTKIGPSDYIDHLNDNKVCYINIQGRQFGNVPFSLDVKLSVEDGPNSAGVMVDVIRLLKLAKDHGLKGYQDFSCYYFKHPMNQIQDDEGYRLVKDFIKKYN